jgi:type IV secretory pathway TrbF-like protein
MRIGELIALRLPRFIEARLGRLRGAEGTESAPPVHPDRNPFLAARHEFMNAFGDLARGKRNWQLIAYALAGLLALLAIADLRLAASSRVVPYIVQVDRLGQVLTVGPAEDLKQPDQRLVASELARFIRSIRTVLPAAAAAGQAEMLRRGYASVAPEAAAFLNDYFANPVNDPRVLGLRLTRQVDVTGVLRVPNSDVWRLQWTETERSTQPGGLTRTAAWEGYVTVRLVPPRTVEAVQDNPLGLAVTSVNWTQVGTSASGDPVAGPDTTFDQGAKP